MSRPTENLTREEARERARLLTDLAYDVQVDVTSEDALVSRSEITFTCTDPGASTFLDVTALRIRHAELNGSPVDLGSFDGTRLTLEGLAAENRLVVEAEQAYSKEGTGMHTFVDPVDDERYLYTQAEPNHAHMFYPCFDQPDLKATFRFEVTAASAWTVLSNAPLDQRREDGDTATWRFEPTAVMSPYVTALVAGPYHGVQDRHGDIDLGVYCRASLAEHLDSDEILEITKQGLDLFPKAFGTPYVWGKYDQVFVPEFAAGAMENAGCVTFNELYIFRSKVTEAERLRRAEVILHEMAHMWFGDLVTMRWWDDLWLNESFATYTSFYAMEKATRFDNAWVNFNDELKAWATYQDQMPTTHPIEADLPDVESVHQNFDGITYAKGASVLRQLAAWVGEDAFFDGCSAYFEEHAYGNATLRDFLGALEKSSGRDLDAWAESWLRTAGVNTVAIETEVTDDRYTRATIVQSATAEHPTLRPHRMAVGVYRLEDGVLERDDLIELDVEGARTEVDALVGRPVADLLLPNDADLAYTKIALDDRAMATITQHLAQLSVPLARTLCWSAAWDMVRDGTLAARRYVDLVLGNAYGESDIGVLQTLLARARTATDLYGDPANRAEQTERLHRHARERLEQAEPGSDRQLAWARHWAATARTTASAEDVRAVLEGQLTFDGLTVDTDLRWHLVGCLVVTDAADDTLVARQLEADPTDLGSRHAGRIRASRPTQDAKAEAWRQVAESDELSHSVADAIARGMRQYTQHALLEPYVERYFDVLPRLWEERSTDRAIALSGELFPLAVVDQRTLARTDEVLAAGDLPAGAVRELREQRDTLVRALRARQIDRDAG